MIKGILYKYLFKAVLIALLGLILFGVIPGLTTVLLLFVGLRFYSLAVEAAQKPITPQRREAMLDSWTRRYEQLQARRRLAKAGNLGQNPGLSPRQLAEAQLSRIEQSFVPPRPKRELGAEAIGVASFSLVIPLVVALYSRDFFSLRMTQGWAGAAVVALCLGLYAWPHCWLKSPGLSELRILWWVIPFALAVPLLVHVVKARHPYLNPFDPEHDRLAAERVLALKNNVVAGQHADWVLRYARQLDQRGEAQSAIHFYREGLRLDANDHVAYVRVAKLEAQLSSNLPSEAGLSEAASKVPYWTAGQSITPSPRGRIDSSLEKVGGCTVVIVPVGEVTDEMLDAIGFVIHHELSLPVFISTNSLPVPDHTRVRGLATGPQWEHSVFVKGFTNSMGHFPNAPIKYLLVTPVDIYMEDANYVVSTSYAWGALVSTFRFGIMTGGESLFRQRTAKQALCALLKSFNLPASPDRNDVTSYARTPEEFDAKGNRPDAETMKLFQQAVMNINRSWQKHLTRGGP